MEFGFGVHQFNSFFSLSPEMMAVLTPEGLFLEVNPAWEKTLGFTPRELKDSPFFDLLSLGDQARAQNEIQRLQEGERSVSFDGQCRRKGQVDRWVRWNLSRADQGGVLCLTGRDVTELKETQKELEESRERFKRLAESATEGVALHEKGVIQETNDALARMFGYETAGDLVGKNGLDLAAPEFRQLILNHIQSGSEEPYEVVGIRKDGTRFNCLLTGKSIQYQGRSARVSTFLDITKAKKREQDLFESQELFRKLTEASKDGVVVSDKGKILMVNPALARMFGSEISEMIGRHAVEFAAPEFREGLLKKVLEETEVPYEVMGLRKDGSRFPIEITPRMTSYQGRKVRVAFFRDITQRKKIEEDIQREKDFSQSLINSSVDGLLAFDAECRYTLWNPTMERISGHSREEVVGQCAFDVFPFLKQIGEDQYFYEALSGRTASTQERPYRTPAGRHGFFEAHYMPIKNNRGEILGGLGIIHDITERKKAEEALRVSELDLKAVFNNTFQNIVLLDLAGQIRAFNANAAVAFKDNSGKDLAVGRSLFDYVQSGHRPMVEKFLAKARKGEVTHLESPYLMGDGQEHWFEVNYHPVFDDRGEIDGICLTSLDIDERKKTEETLQKSEADLRAVFNSSHQDIILVGRDGKIRAFNQNSHADIRMNMGMDLKVEHTLEEYVEPPYVEAFRSRFKRVLKGETVRIERPVKAVDGKERWYEFNYNPVFGSKGRIMGVCVAIASIDERKKSEEALRRSESELRAIFDSSHQSVVLIGVQGLVQNFNKLAAEIFRAATGLQIQKGKPFSDFIRPEDQERFKGHFERVLKGESVQVERAYRFKDGTEHWVEYSYAPVFDADRVITGVCFISQSIDDRKKAEEALRESEEKFRRAFQDAPLGITVSEGCVILEANRAFGEMLGYGPQELLKKSFDDLTHREDLGKGNQDVQELKAGKIQQFQVQKRYLHKDGSPIWVNVFVTKLPNPPGRESLNLTMIENITERMKAEEALRDSEEKFRQVVENAPVGVTLVDRDFRFTFVNRAFSKMLGYSAEELKGMAIKTITHPEDLSQNLVHQARLPETGGFRIQKRYLHKNGSVVWASLVVNAFFNSQREMLYTMGIVENITERLAAEIALRESEERFRKIFEDAPVGMAMVQDYRFTKVNLALCQMLGYEPSELVGKSFQDITHPEDLGASQAKARALKEEKKDFRFQKRYLRKDGSILWADVSGTAVLDGNGQRLYSLIVVENITERKRTEEALQKSEADLRAVFNSGSQVTILIGLDGKIRRFNQGAEVMAQRVLGIQLEEGMLFVKTLPPGASPELYHQSFQAALEGKETQGERAIQPGNGQTRWVEVKYQPVRNSEGAVDGVRFSLVFIDDRKKAEEALRRSESQLRAVFNSGPQVIVLLGLDGRIQAFNKASEKATRKTSQMILEVGRLFLDYVPEGNRKTVLENFESASQGKAVHGERSVRGEDGLERWVEVDFQPVFNEKGEVEGVCYASSSIDERKISEKAVRESQERFERLAQVTREGILIHENPHVVDVNPALAAMMGYKPEEMIGMSGFDLLAPESREFALKQMTDGSTQPYEVMALRKDGSSFPVELHGSNYEHKGRVLRVMSVHDMTWRKETERTLRESEERYRQLVESSPMALLVHRDGKILYLNPEGLKLLGASRLEQLIGRKVMDIVHSDYHDLVRARIQRVTGEGKAVEPLEQKLIRLDGQVIDAEVKGIPFFYEGHQAGLAIIRDVTESRKIQEMLLRYERLAAVGKVIAGIAHEIRTPLGVVSGMGQILKSKMATRSQYSQELDTILTQTNRLKLFMNDILDYSREMEIMKKDVKPRTLLEQALTLAQAQAGPSHVEVLVEWKLEPALPSLSVDADRLEQVLVNLILNAYQAMAGKGKLQLTGWAKDGWVALGVGDNGPGIPEADLPRLFEPFFTTKRQGSGLGLPISRKIVEAHGGHIEVERVLPQGTRFTVYLPLA